MRSETDFIIVIDDEPEVLETFTMLLEFLGFEVLAAASAKDAMAALQQAGKTPVAIIADYRLAGGEVGTDAIHRIQEALGAAIPGIIITGDTSPERIKEAHASGFRIVHKPMQAETLKSEIDTVLDRVS